MNLSLIVEKNIFHALCRWVTHHIQQWPHIFLGLLFAATVPGEAFLVAFHIAHQFQLPAELWLSYIHPNTQRQCLHINLGQSIPVSTFCSLAFCFWVQTGADRSNILASCHICSTSFTLTRTTLPSFTPAPHSPILYISFNLLFFGFSTSHPKLISSILSSTPISFYASSLKHTISSMFYLGTFT